MEMAARSKSNIVSTDILYAYAVYMIAIIVYVMVFLFYN